MKIALIFFITILLFLFGVLFLVENYPEKVSAQFIQSNYRILAQNKTHFYERWWPSGNGGFHDEGVIHTLDIEKANSFLDVILDQQFAHLELYDFYVYYFVYFKLPSEENWELIRTAYRQESLRSLPSNKIYFEFMTDRREIRFHIDLPSKYKNKRFNVRISFVVEGWIYPDEVPYESATLNVWKTTIRGK